MGAGLPLAAGSWLREVLPVPPAAGIYAMPLVEAALYGLLTAGAFALWPLARAMRIPGAALFRDALLPARVSMRGALLAANAALAAALVALTVATADDRRFALWFCAAAGRHAAAVPRRRLDADDAGGAGRRASAASRRGSGSANLHRPGNATRCCWFRSGSGCRRWRRWR